MATCILIACKCTIQPPYEFSPHFLGLASLAIIVCFSIACVLCINCDDTADLHVDL